MAIKSLINRAFPSGSFRHGTAYGTFMTLCVFGFRKIYKEATR